MTAERQRDQHRDVFLSRTLIRYIVVSLTVGLFMALGFLFRLSADAYLLAGIPITLLFQWLIGRAPVRALWLRAAPPFRLDWQLITIAAVIAITPVVTGVRALGEQNWLRAGFCLAAVAGAVAAAYALRAMRGTTLRQLALCIATAGVIGIAIFALSVLGPILVHRRSLNAEASGVTGLESFLLYVPLTFVVEEVFFRGALDSYLHRPDEGMGWISAAYLSGLWGIWHLPIYYATNGFAVVPGLIVFQVAVGVPLSIWWRRSGNLAVTGITHALIDAVRNALQI